MSNAKIAMVKILQYQEIFKITSQIIKYGNNYKITKDILEIPVDGTANVIQKAKQRQSQNILTVDY